LAALGVTSGPRVRVVQWGTGNTGMVALRAILGSPNLELVGVWAHSPTYVGRDVADLADFDTPLGVTVTGDAEAVIELAPQCVCYMASDRGRHDEVIDDLCRLLSAGINVVATTLPVLVHPSGDGAEVRRRLDDACAAGESAFLCTGIEPGFMADALVLHLTSLSRDITGIHVQEAMNVGGYRVPRWRSGLGNDVTTDAERYVPGQIALNWMGPMAMLAEGLGVKLDRVYEERNLAAAGYEFTVPAGTYGPNDAAALHFKVIGEVDGRPMFVIEHVYRLLDEVGPEFPQPVDPSRRTTRIRIYGSPDIDVDVALGGAGLDATDQGVLGTAMRAVNAIPVVTAAPPGAHSPIDLPLITGRGAIRH
jgi:2,4-diaminopentanoate dehydrogenase